MRVVAGSAKSLKLKTIEGMETRPTQDRIKETLFNMIQYPGKYISGSFLWKWRNRDRGIEQRSKGSLFC